MLIEALLVTGLSAAPALRSQTSAAAAAASANCAQAVGADAQSVTETCLGNDARKRGEAAPKESAQRTQAFETAAAHYRRAVALARESAATAVILDALATTLDAEHLNDPAQQESVLREWIAMAPTELPPLFKLADVQERQSEIDAAEDTLQSARRRQPDSMEPYKQLAQFYARRVAALQPVTVNDASADSLKLGVPDDNGVYRIGLGVEPPKRTDIPRYPKEAEDAGVTGVVIVEVLVDPHGGVADAKVVRSIPLLDEEALRAVRTWHFSPSMVNGQAVPVRMNVTVSFAH